MSKRLPFERVLLKISGEALSGLQQFGFRKECALELVEDLKEIQELGVSLALVIGGGNIFRGKQANSLELDRIPADHIGMLSTLINAITFQNFLQKKNCPSRIFSSFVCPTMVETYCYPKAKKALENKEIILFAGGTGNPYFTTDTAAALRACEMEVDLLLKGTKVDGVFTSDPIAHPSAKKIPSLTYDEFIKNGLKVMDEAAIALCRDAEIPIKIFDIFAKGALKKAILNEPIGSMISKGKNS